MKTLPVTAAVLALVGVTGAKAQTDYPHPYGAPHFPPPVVAPGSVLVAPALYGGGLHAGALSRLGDREPLHRKIVRDPTGRLALVLDAIAPAERFILGRLA